MHKKHILTSLTITAALALAACSSNDDNADPTNTSELNPNAAPAVDDGTGGDDTTSIAGLWDGTTSEGETSDVVYWDLSTDGVLTRYDYQQDGVATASGENCYIVGDPISVSSEDGDTFSFFNVAVTAVSSDDTLTVTFTEPDINDVDNDGDIAETPTLTWTALTTATLEDLNGCVADATDSDGIEPGDDPAASDTDDTLTEPADNSDQTVDPEEAGADSGENTPTADADNGENTPTTDDMIEPVDGDGNTSEPVTSDPADGSAGGIPFDNSEGRPFMTRAECTTAGGIIIGDIGDGAIHRPEYRCESGEPPVARIAYLEGEPISSEGEVCCL